MSIQNLQDIQQDLSRYMNPTRRKLLFLLDQQVPKRLTELSRLTEMSDRTCKASVQRLVALGLVQVRESKSVALTVDGAAYVRQLKLSFRQVVAAGTGN